MRIVVLLLILGSTCMSGFAAHQVDFFITSDSTTTVTTKKDSAIDAVNDNTKVQSVKPRFRKLKAALLALLLGHFGVHRIYLGTEAAIPVVYSLTLGGGLGLLPLVDFIAIITTKNLDQYVDNDKVIMWVK